jgi:hypothetical protein
MTLIVPSYRSGFAPRDFEPRHPTLWRGCVGAWCPSLGPTGGVLRDWSGKQNHGTLTNMSLSTAWDNQRSLTFDGTDDCCAIDGSAINNLTAMTVSIWMRTASVSVDWATPISKWSSGSSRFEIQQSGTGLNGPSALIAIVSNGSNSYGYTGSGVLSTNVWYHVAMRFSGNESGNANRIQLYVAGVNQTLTFVGTIPTQTASNAASILAGIESVGTYPFNGQLDDIRIYNRALSPQEIALLASRRGIAYEMDRPALPYTVQSGFLASWSRRPSFIHGGGLR